MKSDCFVCDKHALGPSVPGGVIFEDELIYAGHLLPADLDDVYLGYLIAEPKRHVGELGDLTDREASALGVLVKDLALLLTRVLEAEHVYSFVLGDAVPHLHIHVVPRYPGAPRKYWGVRTSEWPGAPRGSSDDIAAVCARLRREFASLGPTTEPKP